MFRVVYYKNAVEIGSTPQAGSLEAVRQFAKDGLIRHGADMARIIDVDGSGAEVDSVTRDAHRT